MKTCADCGKRISKNGARCRSCANLKRWADADDPRRVKLRKRNQQVRGDNFPYEDREWLRVRYKDRSMSLRQIAHEAQCGLRTIARWMDIHAIATRDHVIAKRLNALRGPAHYNWRGIQRHVCPRCGGRKGNQAKQCENCFDRKQRHKGQTNPNWRGIAEIRRLVRQWTRTDWRPQVYERDRYTCQQCGDARGHNLNAHHLRPLAEIIHALRQSWSHPIDTAEQRLAFVEYLTQHPDVTSIENGITLCEECHVNAHRR